MHLSGHYSFPGMVLLLLYIIAGFFLKCILTFLPPSFLRYMKYFCKSHQISPTSSRLCVSDETGLFLVLESFPLGTSYVQHSIYYFFPLLLVFTFAVPVCRSFRQVSCAVCLGIMQDNWEESPVYYLSAQSF